MENPLTTALEALQDYANQATGKTEPLDEAIRTLVEGYGQGGTEITDGIVINEKAANGNPVKVTFYGAIPQQIFYQAYNNSALVEIDISHATSIGASAFRGCRLLTEAIGDNVTTVNNDYSFSDCTALKTVSFSKLAYVGRTGMFRNCTGLQNVTLGSVGKAVTTISNDAFNGCTQTGLTITVYTTSGYANTLLTNIRRGATNATIVIKSSVDGSTLITD